MAVGRLQIDWPELEPQPGVYDQRVLKEALDEMQVQGFQTFLLISAFDSEGPVYPPDLLGKSIDDPQLIHRFKALMDWVIPLLAEKGGYLIAISNEADNWFGEEPELSGQLLAFLRQIRSHIKGIEPRMAVTVTQSAGNLGLYQEEIRTLAENSDVSAWNFYGTKSPDQPPYTAPKSPEEIRAKVQRLLDFTPSQELVFQELGMHSGGGLASSDPETQAAFFEIFGNIMAAEPRIRTAYLWQLVDWSPQLSGMYVELLNDEVIDPVFLRMYEEVLQSIGLVDYSTGEEKPAWKVFLKWVAYFAD
jgi:hypothetical protein